MHKPSVVVRAAALTFISAAVAQAAPTGIYSNLAGHVTNTPPAGGAFAIGTTSSSAFDRPFLSPDGLRWIIGAIAEGTTDLDLVIVGGGTTNAGAIEVARESVTAIPGEPASLIDAVNTQMGINIAGGFAFSADTTAATGTDQVVFSGVGTTLSVAAREGQAAPGGSSAQNYGATLNAAHIQNSGQVNFRSVMTPTTTNQRLYAGATVFAETDVTIPGSQLTLPAQSIDNFTSDRYVSSADGSVRLYHADLNGATATDLVMVRNNTVLAQEGSVLPGSSFSSLVSSLSADAGSQQLSPNGAHYAFRGSNADGTDWVYRNGSVIAQTDGPIFIGASESFDDAAFAATFFLNAVNNNGDYVIGGTTNIGDVNKDAVLVYNGLFVFLREGDPVDLNGNGLLDDNAYIDVFGNDDGVLTDDLHYYFVAALQDSNNVSIGNAFLVTQIPEPGFLSGALLGLASLARRRRG